MPYNEEATLRAFSEVLKTVHRLRAPGGCPWDREQTHQSLRKFLIEETYEVTDVLDRIDSPESLNDADLASAFCEEWGDLLLQILLLHMMLLKHSYLKLLLKQLQRMSYSTQSLKMY